MITVGHQNIGSVQQAGRPDVWTPEMVYIGMPGNASRAYGITDESVPGFGKPWHLLQDPRGWEIAYREFLWNRMLTEPGFADRVVGLHGKTLLCWCLAKAQRRSDFTPALFKCHGVILARAICYLAHGEETR